MLKNHIKIAIRNLWRQKGYSFLNIIGLAVGLACTFLIVLWIQDELSYDDFHESGDQIYRVRRHVQFGGDQIYTQESVPWPLARTLEEEYPEIEDVALITWPENLIFNRGELSTRENGLHTDPEFFEMFSWDLILGEATQILQDPASIVISASLAKKYFGNDWHNRAVGESIRIDNREEFIVTGVFEDIPHNSSLRFDFVLPMEEFIRRQDYNQLNNWSNSRFLLFLRTHKGTDRTALSEKIVNIQNDHIEGFRSDLFLQPYADQHLHSNYEDGVLITGRIEYYIRIFGVVAFMIVLIACINFMNLATARSMRRAKEVGVRKAIGAGRVSIVRQFMGESLLLVFAAFILAMGLVVEILPFFNDLTGKAVTIADLGGSTLLLFIGIGLFTSLLAGTYPALYLSSFDAVKILRGTFHIRGSDARLRKGLVFFQFVMSILLIIGTVTVYQQIRYIHSKNLGLDRENVIYLPLEGSMGAQFDTVKDELLHRPGIASVSFTSSNPLEIGSSTHSVTWQGNNIDSKIEFYVLSVSFDFLDVMKMELVEGRDFNPSFGTDSVNYIINEKAREVLGFEDPLGEQLSFWGNSGSGAIIGVVKDFHMTSFYSEIEPTIIRLWPSGMGQLFIRTEPGQTREALASLEEVYKQFNPEFPFEYQFLDETFDQMYRSEMVIGTLAGIFTAIALFIACLGLFGLASFTTQQRTKEIGVRKVLGATVANIVGLLSKDFINLVLAGFVIAIPIAWYIMNQWLADFAYKIKIGPGIFAIAGGAALLIALATVSWQSVKAALMNPVNSLRSE